MSYFVLKIYLKGTSKEIHQMITGKLPPIDGAYIWHGRGLNLSLLRNDVSSTQNVQRYDVRHRVRQDND